MVTPDRYNASLEKANRPTPLIGRAGRVLGGLGLVAAGLAVLPATGGAAVGTVRASSGLTVSESWSIPIADGGTPIAMSSPTVATLDGAGPSVVVGDRAGYVYAYHLRDGTPVAGWPVAAGAPVDSTPSINGSTVYVGAGNSATPTSGGYRAINANGSAKWSVPLPVEPQGAGTSAVQASMAVGALQGQIAVVGGSLGQQEDALDAASGGVLPGFPWLQADSNFSTPALADLYGNGQNEIIQGGDSTGNAVPIDGFQYTNGGHIRVLTQTGNLGQQPNGGLACQYNTGQVVQASPAVGEFLGGGRTGIVTGTGTYWRGGQSTNQVLAVDTNCNLAWASTLDGATNDSPALVDAFGNGALQVAEGTSNGQGGGSVYLLNGSNGAPIWSVPAAGMVIGSIVSADLGGGHQDLIVPTTGGVQILDGTNGAQLKTLEVGLVAFQNSPLVTADADGTMGITLAGYQIGGSRVDHFEVAGTNGGLVNEAGAWPEFHHDPQLTGDTAPPLVAVPCRPPTAPPSGYYEVAGDGGLFTFGNLPFCGSTGNLVLQRPVVGMAATTTGGGYWLVASDGGIFSFGDANFLGSTGALRLNSPIVGMAATPGGSGYWLVAADGGIFTFGNATFAGSTGALHLNRPIVGMAATPSGKGYWLVASDGGIFAFGDAVYSGSTGNLHLNQPVVAMVTDAATNGYWLIAADGGVFSFDAPFLGSTGNLHLNRPIVSAQATGGGTGYRFVASDGGVFDFGSALFYGSEGGKALNQPVVGTTGF